MDVGDVEKVRKPLYHMKSDVDGELNQRRQRARKTSKKKVKIKTAVNYHRLAQITQYISYRRMSSFSRKFTFSAVNSKVRTKSERRRELLYGKRYCPRGTAGSNCSRIKQCSERKPTSWRVNSIVRMNYEAHSIFFVEAESVSLSRERASTLILYIFHLVVFFVRSLFFSSAGARDRVIAAAKNWDKKRKAVQACLSKDQLPRNRKYHQSQDHNNRRTSVKITEAIPCSASRSLWRKESNTKTKGHEAHQPFFLVEAKLSSMIIIKSKVETCDVLLQVKRQKCIHPSISFFIRSFVTQLQYHG